MQSHTCGNGGGRAFVTPGTGLTRRIGMGLLSILLTTAATTTFGNSMGASLKVGTTGLGGDFTIGLSDTFNARAGFNAFSASFDADDDDENGDGDMDDITLKLTLQTIPLLVDWHPRGGNFRASAGFVLNNNKLALSADAGDEIEINDVEYRIDSFGVDVGFNQFSPYLGIGYGNAAREGRRFVFACDIGLMFHGKPSVKGAAVASDPALQAALDRDLDEELDDLRDDLKPFIVYPVVTLGLGVRF